MSVAYAAPPSSFRRGTSFFRRANDERLLQLARRGDEMAFSTLFYRYQRPIVSYCTHLMGNQSDGEDAAQYVFYALQQEIQGSSRSLLVRPWLYRVAHNRCISSLRSRREADPLPEGETDLFALTSGCASEAVQQREEIDGLVREVRALPDDQRAALLLTQFSGLSCEEAAGVLQCSSSRLRALVFQARKRLLDSRKAQKLSCQDIQEELSVVHGRLQGDLRRHVAACESCSTFHRNVKMQRKALAAFFPVIPSKLFLSGFGFSKPSTVIGKLLYCFSHRSTKLLAGLKLGVPLAVLPVAVLPVVHFLPGQKQAVHRHLSRPVSNQNGSEVSFVHADGKVAMQIESQKRFVSGLDAKRVAGRDDSSQVTDVNKPFTKPVPSHGSDNPRDEQTGSRQEQTDGTREASHDNSSGLNAGHEQSAANDQGGLSSPSAPATNKNTDVSSGSSPSGSQPSGSTQGGSSSGSSPSQPTSGSSAGEEAPRVDGCHRIARRQCPGDPAPVIGGGSSEPPTPTPAPSGPSDACRLAPRSCVTDPVPSPRPGVPAVERP